MLGVYPVSLCIPGYPSIVPDGKCSFKAMFLGPEGCICRSPHHHLFQGAVLSLLLNTMSLNLEGLLEANTVTWMKSRQWNHRKGTLSDSHMWHFLQNYSNTLVDGNLGILVMSLSYPCKNDPCLFIWKASVESPSSRNSLRGKYVYIHTPETGFDTYVVFFFPSLPSVVRVFL